MERPRVSLPPALDAPGRAAALAEICARHGVRRLDLFGSAATAAFDPARSDVDVLLEWDPDRPRRAWGGYHDLQVDLQALFGRPVDIVDGPTERLRNPYFRRSVSRGLIRLFPAVET